MQKSKYIKRAYLVGTNIQMKRVASMDNETLTNTRIIRTRVSIHTGKILIWVSVLSLLL